MKPCRCPSVANLVILSGLWCFFASAQISSSGQGGLYAGQDKSLSKSGITSSQAVSQTSPKPGTFQAHPGPWGKIIGEYIYLEAPDVLIDSLPMPGIQPRWTFPEESFTNLSAFFRNAGLDEALIGRLLSKNRIVRENHFIHLLPTIPDLESIDSSSRAVIYTELARYPQNEFQVDPLLIVGASVAEWYRSSKLRPALIAKIEKLSYKRQDVIAFSDIQVLLNEAQSDSEVRQIFKAFTRTRSLMLRLVLDRSVNVENLISYWSLGQGVHRKDIEPIILSIIETDGLCDLPLTHLLPPLPRKWIFTYPGFDMAKDGMLPDCHWTSLNFFNFSPDQYLLDSRLAASQVLEKFVKVDPPYHYGVILIFLDNTTGDALHSCVYLADDLVFTKNGRNVLAPWLIMTLDDLKKIYLYRGTGHIQGYQKKDLIPASPTVQ